MCRKHKYKNTNTKYTNTAYDEVPKRPNMWYIFENRIVQGHQKLYSHVPNTKIQIQIHKYTNTAYEEVPERPSIWYIFEKGGSVHHLCIVCVSSVHLEHIIRASSAHHQRIISTSSVHHCSVFIAELSPVYCCQVYNRLLS